MLFEGVTQTALPEDALATYIEQLSVEGIDELSRIFADYADSSQLESGAKSIADDIPIADFRRIRDEVQAYVNLPNLKSRTEQARSSFVERLTIGVSAHREAILIRRLDAMHRSTAATGPCLPGLESKTPDTQKAVSTQNGEAIIKQRMEQYLKEQIDDALRKYDRFASEQVALIRKQADKIRDLYDRRLGQIRIQRKHEFREHESAAQRSEWARKCEKYIQSLEPSLERSSPLQRTLLLYYIAAWRSISDLKSFKRKLVWTLFILLGVVFGLAAYLAWTNEFVREFIDSDERTIDDRIGTRIALNLRQKPVKPSYTHHYRWMMHQTQPAKQFSPHELRDGFFEADWSRGRAFNVSVQLLESWMRRTAEHDKSACVCAQHLGIDRYAVFTSGRMLCDPIVLAETGERHAVRPVGDWLLDDYVKFGVLPEHPTYEVPLGVRVQYLAPHGTYAGLETTMQLIQDSVACIHLCGTLARNPVQNKD